MELKKLLTAIGLTVILFCTTSLYAATRPHFYLQMENRSEKSAAISFEQGVGNVYLNPSLASHTPLSAHEKSKKYEVHIEPMDEKATFNVVFTGKQDCNFNIAFYAPANPKVTVTGPGCYGGGYEITDKGYTLLLYVSDIHLQ